MSVKQSTHQPAHDGPADEAPAHDTPADAALNANRALAELDKALAAEPDVDGHVFSVAAHFLSLLRNEMAARQRETGATVESRRRLEHVNAVISVVLGAHFPLGSVPWAELQKARGWLAEVADRMAVEG